MGTYKSISAADIKTSRSSLNQLVDIVQEDISGSVTRKAYQVFVTGGVGPGVTSSLYHTVYDQNYSFQTANEILQHALTLMIQQQLVAAPTVHPIQILIEQQLPEVRFGLMWVLLV